MELKTVYQYTYFVYPFIIKKERYRDFCGKILKTTDEWSFHIHDYSGKTGAYEYFLPYVKKFLFPTLYWNKEKVEQFNNAGFKKKLDMISGLSSINFKYNLHSDSCCKFSGEGMNVVIDTIEMACFDRGICFLIIKTRLDSEKTLHLSDVLNFNHKFRTINPRYMKKKKTEGLILNSMDFRKLEDLSTFIENLLNGFEDVHWDNVYFDKLFTYSYVCLDAEAWNEEKKLDSFINEFYKFQYVLPADYGSSFASGHKDMAQNTYSRWKYAIYGFTRESGVFLSSNIEKFNSTKLPAYFENIYSYILLLAFYQRIALLLFSQELLNTGKNKIETLKEELTKFTHFSWFSQITNSENGMDLWKNWQKAFDLYAMFDEVQKEYTEYYDHIVARGQEKINLLLIVVFIVNAVFAGMALLINFKIITASDLFAKIATESMIVVTLLIYPFFAVVKYVKKIVARIMNGKI